jgi:arginase
LRKSGPAEAARKTLRSVPPSSPILLHFDIDVLAKQDLPAAYFPHPQGLSLLEASELLGVLAKDPRVRIIEISEYASLRDIDREYVSKLIDLLAASLGSSRA